MDVPEGLVLLCGHHGALLPPYEVQRLAQALQSDTPDTGEGQMVETLRPAPAAGAVQPGFPGGEPRSCWRAQQKPGARVSGAAVSSRTACSCEPGGTGGRGPMNLPAGAAPGVVPWAQDVRQEGGGALAAQVPLLLESFPVLPLRAQLHGGRGQCR